MTVTARPQPPCPTPWRSSTEKMKRLVGVRSDWSIVDLAWLMGLTVVCLLTFGLIPIVAP